MKHKATLVPSWAVAPNMFRARKNTKTGWVKVKFLYPLEPWQCCVHQNLERTTSTSCGQGVVQDLVAGSEVSFDLSNPPILITTDWYKIKFNSADLD